MFLVCFSIILHYTIMRAAFGMHMQSPREFSPVFGRVSFEISYVGNCATTLYYIHLTDQTLGLILLETTFMYHEGLVVNVSNSSRQSL